MPTVNLEVKGNVAKLLATENLVVEHKNVETASFDVDRRILTLPNWKKASEQTFDLLVAHEVGHALYTPAGEWDEKAPHDFINVCEDPRIEKLMKRKYAGLNKTFYNGYSELDEQDFFDIDHTDLEDMNLADRINLHFKVGAFREIPFEEKEFPIVEMVEDAETFDDVLNAAQALYKYCKEEKASKQKEDDLESPNLGGGGSGNNESHPFFDEESDGEGKEEDGSGSNSKGEKEFSDDMTDEELLDALDAAGGKQGSTEPEVTTQRSADRRIEELSHHEHCENSYVEVPKVKYEDVVYSYEKVQKDLSEHFAIYENSTDPLSRIHGEEVPILSYPDNDLRDFIRTSSKEVNYLVKEFEMKKSADAYARASVSKTGVLDTRNLHTYKFNDDIFKKITTLPDGKNHGLVFVLDWSGSMSTCIHDTVKQLVNLVSFCRKVKIPFEVYAFINHYYENADGEVDYYGYRSHGDKWLHERKEGLLVVDSTFRLLNLVSSQAKKRDIDTQIKNLWRMSYQYQFRGGYSVPPIYGLGGTPLNESIISLHSILPYFKKLHDLQKVHAIILTDGEAAGISRSRKYDSEYASYHQEGIGRTSLDWNTYVRNRKTGRTYQLNGHYGATSSLLQNLSDTYPEINLIGIRLCTSRDFGNAMRNYVEYEDREKVHKEWRRHGSVAMKGKGYDSLFAISCNSLDNDVEFEVQEDATKAQIRSAFKKTLKSKSMNKKILSEFVDLVA